MEPKNSATPRYKHSIIILTYNKPELITARVQEIEYLYRTRSDIELCIFDNGSTDPEHALALMEIEKMVTGDGLDLMGVTKAGVSENIGFGQGFNMAVHGSCGEIIHLLSNDVQVRGDFIAPVEESLYLVPRAVVGQTLVANKAGWNEFGGDLPITYLSGHYLAMRRETWDAIGGFDDRYHPYDYEDMDLSMTAMKQGRALLSTPVLPLIHQVAGTIGYTPERFEHTVKMRKLFAEKWGFENIPERP